jgi:hypothetical protein
VAEASSWKLEGFTEWLEIWEKNEPASAVHDGLRRTVIAWIMNRHSDPYQGARRQEGFENYWFGEIPGTYHDGQVVVCSYWIEERTRTVRCDQLGTLSWPV